MCTWTELTAIHDLQEACLQSCMQLICARTRAHAGNQQSCTYVSAAAPTCIRSSTLRYALRNNASCKAAAASTATAHDITTATVRASTASAAGVAYCITACGACCHAFCGACCHAFCLLASQHAGAGTGAAAVACCQGNCSHCCIRFLLLGQTMTR